MTTKMIIPNADFSANAIYRFLETTLVNGYASSATKHVYIDRESSINAIRVRTGELTGKYYIKVKQGFVIRSIAYYNESISPVTAGDHSITGGGSAASNKGLTEYTFGEDNKHSIITFCKTDDTAEISANEDIIAELYSID